MTLIFGYMSKGKAYLAADRIAYDDRTSEYSRLATPKITNVGSYIVGVAGCTRTGQILSRMELKTKPRESDGRAGFMDLIPDIRKVLESNGFTTPHLVDASIIAASKNRVFTIEQHFALIEHEAPYAAIGSGASYALGAAAALLEHHPDSINDPEGFANAVFTASAKHCWTHGPCVDILCFE